MSKPTLIQQWASIDLSTLNASGISNLEQNLLEYGQRDRVDIVTLRIASSRLLIHKYQLQHENIELDLNVLWEDVFLLYTLEQIPVIGIPLENLLTQLRLNCLRLLSDCDLMEQRELPQPLKKLVAAMGAQNQLNDYVHYFSEQEVKWLTQHRQNLNQALAHKDWRPEHSENELLALSLYQQLYELEGKDRLLTFSPDTWPENLQGLAKKTLFLVAEERQLAEEIPAITEIDDKVSMRVRQQYEANPYPRWQKIPRLHTSTVNYAQIIASQLPNFHNIPKVLSKGRFSLLIAGCGTGKESLEIATAIPQADIIAVDICRRSLAYASHKAEQLGVNNVRYYHGDILKLSNIDKTFDLIISAGVLHHMDDPLAGWAVLRDLLKPEGIMQIHLYSEIARQEINRLRAKIAELNLPINHQSIVACRRQLMVENSRLTQCLDFWTLSECRDLLFHTQEHQFTWPKIQDSCDLLGLDVIGAAVSKPIRDLYSQCFPDDLQMNNTNNWDQLEQQNPKLFIDMYAFYCMPKTATQDYRRVG